MMLRDTVRLETSPENSSGESILYLEIKLGILFFQQ